MSKSKSVFKKLESGLYQANMIHATYRIDRGRGKWKLLKLVDGQWKLIKELPSKIACEILALKNYITNPMSKEA